MKKRNDRQVIFKPYVQNQPSLLPPTYDELVPVNHPVRVINKVLDKIDATPLYRLYKPGGAINYHPVMLLKVLVYAYVSNIYSSRKIEAALQESIYFRWLSGDNQPDHNTINRFRGDRLKDVLRNIFTQVVQLLAEEGLLSIKELYTDGTKIEANANRYTFVWGRSISTNKEKIKKQLDELWKYAQSVAAAELDDTDPSGFGEVNAEKVEQTIEKINEALKDKPVAREVKQKLRYAQKNWPGNLRRYEEQERIMGENRSSYSKTDTGATFMRMKEDHMKNGQLKPGYNLQVSSNNQYIVHYSIHQNTTDTATLIPHLNQYSEQYNIKPEVVTADAGYGSEENYAYLENNDTTAYVKYNHFDNEQNEEYSSKKPFSTDKLHYNAGRDCYYCPMGQKMHNAGEYIKTTANGYKQTITKYRAQNCGGCPLKGMCHKAKGNREIEINHELNRLKRQVKELLNTDEGIRHRKQRPVDVEPVFANIKSNHHFKRFMLRGTEKVAIEAGLLALAHNLRKKTA